MLSGCVHLQRKIVLVVFAEIQRLGLGRNTLAGIIFKFAALLGFRHYAALDAQELIFIHLGAVGAVGARMGDFLSEQHKSCPLID